MWNFIARFFDGLSTTVGMVERTVNAADTYVAIVEDHAKHQQLESRISMKAERAALDAELAQLEAELQAPKTKAKA